MWERKKTKKQEGRKLLALFGARENSNEGLSRRGCELVVFKSERERERELGLLGIWEGVVTAIYFRKTRRVVVEPTNGRISVSHRTGEPLVDSCSEGFDSLEASKDLTLQNHFWGPQLCVCQRERSCVLNLKYLNYTPTVSLAHGCRSQRRKKNIFRLTNSSLGQTLAQ